MREETKEKPSEALKRIQYLNVNKDDIFQAIWLGKLPLHVQRGLTTLTYLPMKELAAKADKLMKLPPNIEGDEIKENSETFTKEKEETFDNHGHYSPTSTKTQSPNRDPEDNSKQAKSVFGKASNVGHQSLTPEGETMDDCQGWEKAACHDQTKSQTNHPKRRTATVLDFPPQYVVLSRMWSDQQQ